MDGVETRQSHVTQLRITDRRVAAGRRKSGVRCRWGWPVGAGGSSHFARSRSSSAASAFSSGGRGESELPVFLFRCLYGPPLPIPLLLDTDG